MKLNLWIYNDLISVDLIPFRHREWNHICWTYSFERNWHRIYINGELKASEVNVIDSNTIVWKASSKVEKHAFVIGQEPDSIRGGYTIDQLFQGSITELNVWNIGAALSVYILSLYVHSPSPYMFALDFCHSPV